MKKALRLDIKKAILSLSLFEKEQESLIITSQVFKYISRNSSISVFLSTGISI